MRFSLVRVNEHIDSITLAGGEPDEARRIELDLKGVLQAMRLLVIGTTNLTWVTAGYGWFTLVAPILVAAPLYFAGELSFGGLMMASGAFVQVQSSLRWFVDNFSTLADWRATLLRVASFRRALLACDELHEVGSRIEYAEGEPGKIVIDRLEISSPAGKARLAESHVEVKAGERVLIVGESGAERTLLFRALAGLLALRRGTDRPACRRDDAVSAAYVLPSARNPARGSRLPLGSRGVRHRNLRQGARAARSRTALAAARPIAATGKPC